MRTRKDTAAGAEPGDGHVDAAAQEAIERFARVMSHCGVAPKKLARAFMSALATSGVPAPRPNQGLRELPEAAHLVRGEGFVGHGSEGSRRPGWGVRKSGGGG